MRIDTESRRRIPAARIRRHDLRRDGCRDLSLRSEQRDRPRHGADVNPNSTGPGFTGGSHASTAPAARCSRRRGSFDARTITTWRRLSQSTAAPTKDARRRSASRRRRRKETPIAAGESVLSQPELDAIVSAAMSRWSATGLNDDQLATLRKLKFEVADLPDLRLGEAERESHSRRQQRRRQRLVHRGQRAERCALCERNFLRRVATPIRRARRRDASICSPRSCTRWVTRLVSAIPISNRIGIA